MATPTPRGLVRRGRKLPVTTVETVARHRNGVSGRPFYVVLFRDQDRRRLLGIVFDNDDGSHEHDTCVAVLDPAMANAGQVSTFSDNCFRGDYFQDELRKVIREWDHAERRRLGLPGLCRQCSGILHADGLFCCSECARKASDGALGTYYCPACGSLVPNGDAFCDAQCAAIHYGFNRPPPAHAVEPADTMATQGQ